MSSTQVTVGGLFGAGPEGLPVNQLPDAVRPPLGVRIGLDSSFTAVDGPTVLARDGEVGSEYGEASFSVNYRALPVFRPLP